MYILSKGEVQVKVEDDEGNEETVCVLYQGSVFGEIRYSLRWWRNACFFLL